MAAEQKDRDWVGEMRKLESEDEETAHILGDDLLAEFIKTKINTDEAIALIDAFDELDKWYA